MELALSLIWGELVNIPSLPKGMEERGGSEGGRRNIGSWYAWKEKLPLQSRQSYFKTSVIPNLCSQSLSLHPKSMYNINASHLNLLITIVVSAVYGSSNISDTLYILYWITKISEEV